MFTNPDVKLVWYVTKKNKAVNLLSMIHNLEEIDEHTNKLHIILGNDAIHGEVVISTKCSARILLKESETFFLFSIWLD